MKIQYLARINGWMISLWYEHENKTQHFRRGFELESLVPFPSTMIVMLTIRPCEVIKFLSQAFNLFSMLSTITFTWKYCSIWFFDYSQSLHSSYFKRLLDFKIHFFFNYLHVELYCKGIDWMFRHRKLENCRKVTVSPFLPFVGICSLKYSENVLNG